MPHENSFENRPEYADKNGCAAAPRKTAVCAGAVWIVLYGIYRLCISDMKFAVNRRTEIASRIIPKNLRSR